MKKTFFAIIVFLSLLFLFVVASANVIDANSGTESVNVGVNSGLTGNYLAFAGTTDTKTTTGYLEINSDSKTVSNIGITKDANQLTILNKTKAQSDTILPLFDVKQVYPTDFKMVFSQLDKTKYKYTIVFTGGKETTFELYFSSTKDCNVFDAFAVCDKTGYSFYDVNAAGFPFKLIKQGNGFVFRMEEIKEGFYYYIDPTIDSNMTIYTPQDSTIVNSSLTIGQVFHAYKTGIITAISVQGATSSVNTDWVVQIWNVNPTTNKPTSIVDANCSVSYAAYTVLPAWTTVGWADFNFTNNCHVTADLNYAIVSSNAQGGNTYVWVGTKQGLSDKNAWASTDGGSTWTGNSSYCGASLCNWTFLEWLNINPPVVTSLTRTPNGVLNAGTTINIKANGITDSTSGQINFFCDENNSPPASTTNLCTQGDYNYSNPYSDVNCSYTIPTGTANRTVYCRAFNPSTDYSNTVTTTYSTWTNYLKIGFVDEQTGAGKKPDALTIDGNSWIGNVDANGLLSITNLNAITATTHSIIATKSGFGTRQWDLNFGASVGSDYNFGMRTNDINSAEVYFKFYDSTGTTLLNSKIMKVTTTGTNLLAGKKTTTSAGLISFFLDLNSEKYTIQSYDSNDSFIADYNSLKQIIKIPLDETNPTILINPYSVNITGTTGYDDNSINTDSNFHIYSNLLIPNTITIGDNNSAYYDRSYIGDYRGNATITTLQPYLIPLVEASSLVFITKDNGLNTVSGVKIVLSKQINGTKTTIISGYTDIAGIFPVYVQYGTTYMLDVYYPEGTLIITTNDFKPAVNPTYIYISTGTITGAIDLTRTKVTFIPRIDYIYSGATDLNQIIDSDITFSRIRIYIDQNNNGDYNILYDANRLNYKYYNNDINIATITGNIDFNYNFGFTVHVELWDGGNLMYKVFQNYHTGTAAGNLNFMEQLKKVRGDFNCSPEGICFGTSLLSLFFSILVIFGISAALGRFDPMAMSVIGIIALGFFTVVAWFDVLLLFPIAIIALFLIRGDW